jgi:hypothetical protein
MEVRQIGFKVNDNNISHLSYFSTDYLLEADILIIDLDEVWREINHNWILGKSPDNYMQEDGLNKISAFQKDRRKQITEYLERGGNLFVWCPKLFTKIVDVEKSQNYESLIIDLLSFINLSSKDFTIKLQSGKIIQIQSEYQSFFEKFRYSYSFYFDKYYGNPIGCVTNTTSPVTLNIPCGNGNVILLPELTIAKGTILDAFVGFDKLLKEKLHLKSKREEAPAWVENYNFGSEEKEVRALIKLQEEQKTIEKKIVIQKVRLDYFHNLKRLIFSTGSDLELIVEEVLKEIGYSVKQALENRDDLILSYNEQVAVIEIKGVKGSAAEKYAAQLMKWVSTYHAENEINPKGILIVNAFKDKPLKDRIEEAFPNQMLAYNKQQRFCLITTIQLLELYLDFKDGILTFEKVNKLLFTTVGVLRYNSKNKIKEISPAIVSVPLVANQQGV